MRYLLDTNSLSNVTKPAPSAALLTWMSDQTDASLFISLLTLAEIRRGILEKPAGKKREQLEAWFSGARVRRPFLLIASYRGDPGQARMLTAPAGHILF